MREWLSKGLRARATVVVVLAGASVRCAAHDPVVRVASASYPAWPEGATPDDSAVYVHNEITVAAPPPVVWAWLARADLWPSWFEGATSVRFDRGGPELGLGAQVSWHMIGSDIHVAVRRAEPPSRLDWEGGARGVHAYHTWFLEPAPGGGTRIVTDETERGVLPWTFRSIVHGKVHDAHQAWLESLARVVAKGAFPPAAVQATSADPERR